MPEAPERFQFVADRGDAGRRLDQVVVRRVSPFARLSRTEAQSWIDAGAVEVDGRARVRPSTTVLEGASIAVTLPADAKRRERPSAESSPLEILFQDDHLMAINKPPGVVVHPTYKQTGGTVLNAILGHVGHRGESIPGILTRLDKGTSGLVLVALSAGVHATSQRDVSQGHVRKEYLAVVAVPPSPARGRITFALARDPHDRRRVIATDDGAASETRYETLAASPGAALVRCELITGRTHQIRVHLSTSGWPIAGDPVYGSPRSGMVRQALHAWRISMPHPVTRVPLTIIAPPPDDFTALLRAEGLPQPPAP